MRCIVILLLTVFLTVQMSVSSFGQESDVEIQRVEDAVDFRSIDKENFDSAFRTLKNQDQLQFELAEAPPPPKLDWLERILEPVFKFFVALAPLFEVIFWTFVIGAIGLILYIVGRALWNFRLARLARDKEEDEDTYLYQPSQEQARILLDAVDALAAKGLYAEAVHQLLFRSVQDIGIARPNMIRRSYTSREIATLSELTPKTREAFSLIAAEVERSHFGGRSLDEAVFQKCRTAYAQFAIPTRNEESLIIKNGVTA